MNNALAYRQVCEILQQESPSGFLECGKGLVERLATAEQQALFTALNAQGQLQNPHGRLDQLQYFLRAAEIRPPDVERDGRQFAYGNLNDLPITSHPYADVHTMDLERKGWPLNVHLMKLDGRFEPVTFGRPTVYFVHEGTLSVSVANTTHDFTKSSQVAIPGHAPYILDGKATLYALDCQPNMNAKLSVEHFDDDRKKNKCPCGWSYRIPLVEKGWGFSTHRTKISGAHDPTNDGFAGHQHKKTPELYFTDRLAGSTATITIDGVVLPLSPGMLVAIPNGTMHAVDCDGEIDQHIFVGGGHKDDFWTPKWNRLPGTGGTPANK